MRKLITRLVVPTGLSILLVASLAPAADAAKPVTFPAGFTVTGTIDCGTFEDNFIDVVEGTGTLYFDSAGDPIRVVFQQRHTSTDVNSVTGLTVHEHGHYTQTVDFVAGTNTFTGNQEIATRHGVGVVIQDTGRVVYAFDDELVFFAGGRKHSQELLGDQVLCDALA